MTLFIKRFISALTLATLVVFGSVEAASDVDRKPDRASQKAESRPAPKAEAASDDSKKSDRPSPDRASQRAERRKAPKDEPGMTQKELNTCKHDAHGKDGPERARFMTDCLKDR
jgi:hypothetical protein